MRLHLVDGTFELFRAHYAPRPDRRTPDGRDVDRVVLVDRIRKTELNEEGLKKRRGVSPESIPDLLALTGDEADGIPGLPGFGEKTAGLLLSEFVHIEKIPPIPMRWPRDVRGALRLSATLEQRRSDALLYRKLATLRLDAPVAATLEEMRFAGVPRAAFHSWCD